MVVVSLLIQFENVKHSSKMLCRCTYFIDLVSCLSWMFLEYILSNKDIHFVALTHNIIRVMKHFVIMRLTFHARIRLMAVSMQLDLQWI